MKRQRRDVKSRVKSFVRCIRLVKLGVVGVMFCIDVVACVSKASMRIS